MWRDDWWTWVPQETARQIPNRNDWFLLLLEVFAGTAWTFFHALHSLLANLVLFVIPIRWLRLAENAPSSPDAALCPIAATTATSRGTHSPRSSGTRDNSVQTGERG
jgi:hypothetical protein